MSRARDAWLFVLALGASAAAYAHFGVSAHRERFAVLDDRVRIAHRRVGEEEARSAHLEQLMTDVAWLREALARVRERMESADDTPQFLLALAEVLRAHELDADGIDPGERVQHPPLSLQTVRLEVRGTFARVSALVAAIERLPPHCRVTAIELERASPEKHRANEAQPLLRARLEVARCWSAEP